MMNELEQAVRVATALPELQRQEVARASALLWRLPITEVAQLADAIELRSEHGGAKAGNLREHLMMVRGERVRVAEWTMEPHPQTGTLVTAHKRYAVGDPDRRSSVNRVRHGEIGDESWLEAWIA